MPSAGGSPATWTYDVRGEVTSSRPTPIIGDTATSYATSETLYANGTPIEIPLGSKGAPAGNTTNNGWSLAWDDKMGVVKSMRYSTNNLDAKPPQRLISTTSSSWSYDGAGRLTSETSSTAPVSDTPTTWTLKRTFDSKNHETDNGNMVWGPNGHPALISTGTKFQTLHWDGNQLLFATELRSGSGALVDIKVGSDGDITPLDSTFQGLTFYDRGPGGLVLGCHNKQGTTYVGLSDARAGEYIPSNPVCSTDVTPSTAKFPTVMWSSSPCPTGDCAAIATEIAAGTVLGMPRPDGYAWGLGTLQGTRTFDSSAGTWTTPDAYGGDVHDPMSQKSYMWNGNNAVGYADPTGYDPIPQGNDGGGGQPLFTDWSMTGSAGYDNPTFGNAMQQVQVASNTAQASAQSDGLSSSQKLADGAASAAAAGEEYEPITLKTGVEYGGKTYVLNGTLGYTVVKGSKSDVDVDATTIPDGATETGNWHTHPAGAGNEYFSPPDLYSDQQVDRENGFLITPSGSLKVDLFMNYQNPLQVTPNVILTLCQGCLSH